jgi:hypothetical protein
MLLCDTFARWRFPRTDGLRPVALMNVRPYPPAAFLGESKMAWLAFCVAVFFVFLAATCQLTASSRGAARFVERYAGGEVQSMAEIPAGYVLPLHLEQTLSVKHVRAGDSIEARIMQEVPLPNRRKIPLRSIVKGTILHVARDEDEIGVQVTLRFDTLIERRQTFSVLTGLRAIASNLAVHEAQMPLNNVDETQPLGWASTVQIGGDYRFGDGDKVRNRHKETVGKAVPGGVLVYVSANPKMGCDGPPAGDNQPQALWLFSADACGVYGLKGVQLTHNGQSAPLGEITLHFKKADMVLRAGDGLLLTVLPQP